MTSRIAVTLAFAAAVAGCTSAPQPPPEPFSVVEATIQDMQQAMRDGRVTSRQIVEQYLQRIGLYEDRLNATIAVNPKALEEADRLDEERRAGKIRGPLHGIPVALKDNIHTTDMPTTGGAIAFEGFVPPYEATLTKNLRDAGAIILAKTTMTELANFVANGMPGNYNALVGYAMNPYDPRRDPRQATGDGRPVLNTGGSSSGVGTAANFWAANVGTETSGSILSPSNQNMLAGIKPTVGRISRYGVIPITADQDTAGPMAKWVADAAIMLGAMEGAAPDPNDPATSTCQAPPNRDYTPHLKRDGLKGARIGIPRASYYDRVTPPGQKEPRGGLNEAQATSMAEAIEILKQEGATVVDADIPSVIDPDPTNNLLLWGGGCGNGPQDPNCSSVLWYGMKRDFNAWLATLGPGAPVKTLAELRAFNTAHANRNAIKYGQANLDRSDALDLEKDRAKWQADRERDIRLSAAHGIDEALQAHQLDALLFPGPGSAGIAARPGYPTVIVPFGLITPDPPRNAPFPDGFTPAPAPYGVSFTGTACSEPRLIELAYAFEQASKRRVPPPERAMNDTRPIAIIAAILVVLAGAGAWWFLRRPEPPVNQTPQAVAATEAPVDQPAEAPVVLPPLEEMDGFLRPLLSALSARPELAAWLATDDLVRQLAAAIDQASRGASPARDFKVVAPRGPFAAAGRGARRTISPASYARYDGLVDTVTSTDPAAVAKIYQTIRPRLNEAYRGMGHPDGDVDRALHQALDILLDTPVPDEPITVVERGAAGWAYANPELEALRPSQKQLVRMGPAHTEAMLTWLGALERSLQ